jgi:hypothetical protein
VSINTMKIHKLRKTKMKLKLNLQRLSKFIPTFRRKSRPIPALAVKPAIATAKAPAQTSTALAVKQPTPPAVVPPALPQPRPNPAELLDSVVTFLRQHLVCDDHRLNVLALWIAHTWCFQASPTAVYLDVRSPESHSGKSTCLQLLALLSAESWLATGPDPRTVVSKLLTEGRQIKSDTLVNVFSPCTILLDNHHHTLGRSERQGLLAMLCSGACAVQRYTLENSEYWLFGPKAFAGNGPLPHSLAERCLPVTLHRRKSSEAVTRLNPRTRQNATALARQLQQWAADFSPAIAQAAVRTPANIPTQLILSEFNNSEPLFHIADAVGGPWPERVRAAVPGIYSTIATSLQLTALGDVRYCFFLKDNPDYLLTRDILDMFETLEHRPWSSWPKKSGGRLGALLRPFGVYSTNLNFSSGKRLKGYTLADFKEAWERYLAPLPYKSIKDVPPGPTVKHNNF